MASIRVIVWFAPNASALAIIFLSNTNTKWALLVPLTEAAHFPDVCQLKCLAGLVASSQMFPNLCWWLLPALLSNSSDVGYFCGYTTKRQVVGKYELDQAANSMNLFKESLKKSCFATAVPRHQSQDFRSAVSRYISSSCRLAMQRNPSMPANAREYLIDICGYPYALGVSIA